MHRTLKAATARPPQAHLPAQQRACLESSMVIPRRPNVLLSGARLYARPLELKLGWMRDCKT
jgi:hypothetical protein